MIYNVQVGGDPIYRQIINRITHQVASGRLVPGDQVPSVRELARQLVINPMTVSKAYTCLVNKGVLIRKPGDQHVVAGSSVSETLRIELIKPYMSWISEIANDLQLSRTTIISLL